MKRKIFYCFIFFLLLIAFVFPLVSLGTYENYVALGDSIPAGYYLEDEAGDNYAQKLREQLNISPDNFQNLSVVGETTKRFYEHLQSTEWTDAVSNADLITITIAGNELVEILAEAVSYATGVPVSNDREFPYRVAAVFLNATLSEKTEMITKLCNHCISTNFRNKINKKIIVIEEYWRLSINYIRQLNPNATIVVTDYYNPYYEIALLNFDFGGWIDTSIKRVNEIIYNYSNSGETYKVTKLHSFFNTTNPRLTYANLSITDLGYDPHPTLFGHEIIAAKIRDTLNSNSTQNKKDISSLSISHIDDQKYTGKAIKPKLVIKDGDLTLAENTDYYLLYNNNTELGQATIMAIGTGNYTGKVIKNFNIYNSTQKNISNCTIDSILPQVYLDMKLEPEITIKDGENTLTKNMDYTLRYQNNMNVGFATVIVTGIGNYTGTINTNFIIAPCPMKMTNILDIPDQLYTGNEITPDVILSLGTKKLIKHLDYTVNYSSNIEKGTATVTITGMGYYTGTITKEFNIVSTPPAQLQDISEIKIFGLSEPTYAGFSTTPLFEASLNNKTLKIGEDFLPLFNNNINSGTANISLIGIGDYTGTVNKTFTIEKKSIENLELNDITDHKYTGKNLTPQVTVSDNLTKLVEGTDYTVTYSNNINSSLATIQINGKGNYTGTIYKTFNITDIPHADDNKPTVESTPGNIDNTVSSNKIPHAGIELILFICMGTLTILAILFYNLSKKEF